MKAIQNASKTGKYFLKRSDDQYIRYELNPNYQGTIDKVKIRINSQGFRGREYGVDKKDRIRIILLGDSITFAKTFEEGKTYAVLLEKLLKKLNPKTEVLNMGVDGYDTLQEVLEFKKNGLKFSPDLVLVCYCLNDIGVTPLDLGFMQTFLKPKKLFLYHFRIWQWINVKFRKISLMNKLKKELLSVGGFDAYYGSLFQPVEKDQFLEDQFSAIQKIQEEFQNRDRESKQAVIDKPGHLWLNQYTSLKNIGKIRYAFEQLKEMADSHNFQVMVVIIPFLYKINGRYLDAPAHAIIQNETHLAGFKVIDLYERLDSFGFEKINLDGVHLNALGHQLLADILFQELRQSKEMRHLFSK
jgi:lysophospholipase L1-like esterase